MREIPYSVVIATKDRAQILPTTIGHLLAQTDRPARVVLVDASEVPFELDPELVERARADGVEVELMRAPPSTSGQRNAGLAKVETPLVLFLDDDVELPQDYVETVKRRWAERGGLDALGGASGSAARPAPYGGRLGRLYRRAFMLHYPDPAAVRNEFRLSQKLRFRHYPDGPVLVPALSTMAVLYRTDLARKHRFDEHFTGYALGEDLDMAWRLSHDAPLLQVPDVRYVHAWAPGDRGSPRRWYFRGRCDAYFRLKRLDRTPQAVGAFALSFVGELIGATADSLRERDPSHVRLFVRGFAETLRDRPRHVPPN